MLERDTLKTCLQKKHDDHIRTHGILRKTTNAFGECLSAFKHGSDNRPLSGASAAGPSVQRHEAASMLPAISFDEDQFRRTSQSELLPMNVEGITIQDLREQHRQLVSHAHRRVRACCLQISKFNADVQASLKDEANAKKLMMERNMALSENTALSLNISELQKVRCPCCLHLRLYG